MNWEDCPCPLIAFVNWSVFAYAVGKEASEFICEAACPSGVIGSFE